MAKLSPVALWRRARRSASPFMISAWQETLAVCWSLGSNDAFTSVAAFYFEVVSLFGTDGEIPQDGSESNGSQEQ